MEELQVRDAIVAYLVAGLDADPLDVPVVYDNMPFDWNDPPPAFVQVEIKFYDGTQIGASANPRTRLHGYIYITSTVREGTGGREPLRIKGHVSDILKYARFSGVQLGEPSPDGTSTTKGWYYDSTKIRFFADPT